MRRRSQNDGDNVPDPTDHNAADFTDTDATADSPPPWDGAPVSDREAVEQAVALVKTLRAVQHDLATSTAGLQRLQLTATAAWMRALMALYPESAGVEAAARDALQGCVVLAKRWWPGHLPILSLDCEAAEIGASFGPRDDWSWSQIALQAERYIAQTQTPPAEFLPLVWADADHPADASQRPLDPERVLAQAYKTVENTLRQPLDSSPPAWHDGMSEHRLDAKTWAALATAAAQLRWVRQEVRTARPWAEAMGRLRWLVFHRRHAARELQRWLDPEVVPSGGWGKQLGVGPDPASTRGQLRALLEDFRGVHSSGSRAELLVWLRRALDLDGELLPATKLASLLSARAAEVFALQDRDLHIDQDRERRKLKKLKAALAKRTGDPGDPRTLVAAMLAHMTLESMASARTQQPLAGRGRPGGPATRDRGQGAPALNDQVWLYGSEPETLVRIISEGPYGVMPSWSARLSEAEIRALAVYVHGLGGGE